MNDGDNEPLPLLFRKAQRLIEVASDIRGSSAKAVENQRAAQAWLRRCEDQVDNLGLFSANEQVEDIATGDLKYLLVAGYLGDLLSDTDERRPENRKAVLAKALQCYRKKKSHSSRRFLSRCEQYELVPPEARIAQSMDAQTKRQLKIQRFQKDKQSRARLNQIDSLHETLDDSKDEGSGDLEREAWLIRIELAVMKAAEQSSQIKQEIEMLSHAISIPEAERQKPLPPPPADLLGKLHLAATNLGKQRQQVAADVFRPSHNLPTRSLAQQADIEIAQAQEQARSQEQATKMRAKLEADEDYMLQKQRNWDDWKDDHERGSGNDKLRPTA